MAVFKTSLANGFCGFYVAKAGSELYNKASQVVIVRSDKRTAITMVSDYRGEFKDFALVVPVPEVLKREQINVADRALVDRIDAFTAPRLVEYFDPDPCNPPPRSGVKLGAGSQSIGGQGKAGNEKVYGVTVEASYTVGEYDISILAAKESLGLERFLIDEGYRLPDGASKALTPYIKQGMKFFVAKVNLKEQSRTGYRYLRPIQFAFESSKYMLPLRLGMLNASGAQDLIVYAISREGRVETTNYQTVKVPTDKELPLFVKAEFSQFYLAMLETSYKKEGKKAVFLEYASNMSWCDPCAVDPLSPEELRKLGVFWLEEPGTTVTRSKGRVFVPKRSQTSPAFVTRLHVRYDESNFAEDLFFQETGDQKSFQGRYVVRHPWSGKTDCELGKQYEAGLPSQMEERAKNLAGLTGWNVKDVYKKIGQKLPKNMKTKWYERIFK